MALACIDMKVAITDSQTMGCSLWKQLLVVVQDCDGYPHNTQHTLKVILRPYHTASVTYSAMVCAIFLTVPLSEKEGTCTSEL